MAEGNKLPNDSFNVSVIETLERMIEVDADTPEEAINRVKQLHENGEILLDARDSIDTQFDVWGKDDEPEEPVDWKAKYEELDKRFHILIELICENDLEEYIRQEEQL